MQPVMEVRLEFTSLSRKTKVTASRRANCCRRKLFAAHRQLQALSRSGRLLRLQRLKCVRLATSGQHSVSQQMQSCRQALMSTTSSLSRTLGRKRRSEVYGSYEPDCNYLRSVTIRSSVQ